MNDKGALSKLSSAELWTRVKDCRLPSPPVVAQQLLTFFEKDDDRDPRQLAQIISRDPALSARILKLINSAYYGLGREITTLSHAVVILGPQTVRSHSLSFCLTQGLRQIKLRRVEHYEGYWKRSLLSALCARYLSLSVGSRDSETAFLAALLQDIGILVLAEAFRDDYERLLTEANGDHDRFTASERRLMGMDHLSVGSWLVDLWHLPEVFRNAIKASHSRSAVDLAESLPVRCVALSGYLADIFLRSDVKQDDQLADAGTRAELLGFDPADLAYVLEGFGEKASEVSSFFEINLGESDCWDSVWEEAQTHPPQPDKLRPAAGR